MRALPVGALAGAYGVGEGAAQKARPAQGVSTGSLGGMMIPFNQPTPQPKSKPPPSANHRRKISAKPQQCIVVCVNGLNLVWCREIKGIGSDSKQEFSSADLKETILARRARQRRLPTSEQKPEP